MGFNLYVNFTSIGKHLKDMTREDKEHPTSCGLICLKRQIHSVQRPLTFNLVFNHISTELGKQLKWC